MAVGTNSRWTFITFVLVLVRYDGAVCNIYGEILANEEL